MKKTIKIALAILVSLALFVRFAMPTILHKAGLHAIYEDAKEYDLKGKKALVITTSHSVLNAPGETTGNPTGVMASEMTVPYYEFLDAGMEVDVASIKGGKIPVDPQTLIFMLKTPEDERFLKDNAFQEKVNNSLQIDAIDFTKYDAIFMAGGWGAAYDLGYSKVLGEKISEAYYAQTPVIGSVCHGGLIQAKDTIGNYLITGRTMTGVTDKQIKELGIAVTPQHPESELRKLGVNFKSNTAFRDFFAHITVVDEERRFVTGQNQNSGYETAQQMMAIIMENSGKKVLD